MSHATGERSPLGAPCRYCDSDETFIGLRFEFQPVGTYSLAGVLMRHVST